MLINLTRLENDYLWEYKVKQFLSYIDLIPMNHFI